MAHARLTRRSLLRAAGASALALGVGPRVASAATKPKRIIFCVTMHGFFRPNLELVPPGKTSGDAYEFPLDPRALSPILEPLAPWTDRLLVLDGLSMNSAIADYWTALNPHVPGHIHLLTGAPTAEQDQDGAASTASVDQRIAAHIMASRDRPAFGSVEVGFGQGGGIELGAYNWSAPSTSLPYLYEPAALFDLLFDDLGSGNRTGTDTKGLPAWRERLARFASDEHAALLAAKTGASAERLAVHRDLLAALADRFAGLDTLACMPPTRPQPSTTYADRYADHAKVLAAAFACDLTRVATIAFESQDAIDCGGLPGSDLHGDYAHSTTEDATDGDEESDAVMTTAATNHAGHLATLLATLADVQEDDGSTLLDHTIVVWTSELARGRHQGARAYSDLPVILAGGDAFALGRYVSYAEQHAPPMSAAPVGPDAVGPSHNHLLVSLCRAMGLGDVTTVGVESVPLMDGTALDCTGPLDSLV